MGVTLKEKRERFLKSLKVDQDIKEMLETKDSNEELQLSKFNNWLKKEMDEER